jgi:NADH:ubiquinone oxidoreductase subunit K
MAGIFDSIPVITVILFAIGLVGIMVYERSRTKTVEESNS